MVFACWILYRFLIVILVYIYFYENKDVCVTVITFQRSVYPDSGVQRYVSLALYSVQLSASIVLYYVMYLVFWYGIRNIDLSLWGLLVLSTGEIDQIIMENTICPECKLMPTNYTSNVCGEIVCPQCSSDIGFDELDYVWYKYCNQKPVQNSIWFEILQLPMNNTCRLCVILVCHSFFWRRVISENDIQCKDFQEGKINAPSVAQMFMSKRGSILHKPDSSSSIHYSPNNINDTSASGM